MKRAEFDSLDHSARTWACIEPTIQQIRGKNLTVKSRVYAELTLGQRSLLMFWVLHGHTRHGTAQFYDEVAYLLAGVDLWQEMKVAMSYFGDGAMLRLVRQMEELSHVAGNLEGDTELAATADRLDALLAEMTPATIQRIDSYIRDNPFEFVHFED